jgi:inorganic pyrophosphatase
VIATSLIKLTPYDEGRRQWRVVVETPRGSRNKYRYDEAVAAFVLDGILPEGMNFPYDFGFLPSTLGADGDPLDVLLLMDEPAFSGCIVPSRLIGVIEAEQTERDGETARNDRLVAVPVKCRPCSDYPTLLDVNRDRVHEIGEFFVSYNRVRGKQFKVLDVAGPERAEALALASLVK